ncbi:FtsW/RodA/SpoVE family cell cycle protein [Actinoallomurus rhizosphaericola]|uniref:FtsW/RodA/SpoVE family cell cycle protein n=1 Tax=Actinoallomurus rhizosphaericola TaxID=2952536 RepID=UPI00209343D5|nr:FtsW/RodA/SpoVE family cell cycle protein [Actinoallomurus rhizosphaericola]MCO5998589.1 FtsW/RodA/SpoVE family cell cycle protein [Actinoallomurus rhizosphaericola]
MTSAAAEPEVQIATRPRRSAQLAMLIFAMVITIAGFAQVGLARDGSLPTGMYGYGAGLGVLVAISYVVVARFAPYADPLLLPLAVFLNGIGLAMIYRLDLGTSRDVQLARAQGKNPTGLWASAPNQLMWTALSIAAFAAVIVLLREIKILQRYMYTIGAVGLFFLALPGFLPSSISGSLGAKIWIRLGPFSIQPSEFSKLALVAFFAGYLVNKRQALSIVGKKIGPLNLPRARDLGPILVIWVLTLGVLALENDFGTAILFFGLFVSMLYIATERFMWVAIGGLLLAFASALTPFVPHVQQRINIWLDPKSYFDGGCQVGNKIINQIQTVAACHARGGTYIADSGQLMRGLFSLGQGGVLGTGLGQGEPWRTPYSFSDFIFTSFGEELGLTGAMVILIVYALIVQRGMKAALATKDNFAKLFAGGVSFVFALQVFVIVGGVTRLIPLTGLTTPFLAQGGSSLLANWILIALLIRISDTARRPAPQPIQDEGMTQVVRTQ